MIRVELGLPSWTGKFNDMVRESIDNYPPKKKSPDLRTNQLACGAENFCPSCSERMAASSVA
jgi:hypothetical protein